MLKDHLLKHSYDKLFKFYVEYTNISTFGLYGTDPLKMRCENNMTKSLFYQRFSYFLIRTDIKETSASIFKHIRNSFMIFSSLKWMSHEIVSMLLMP